jgi:hypothetical protein
LVKHLHDVNVIAYRDVDYIPVQYISKQKNGNKANQKPRFFENRHGRTELWEDKILRFMQLSRASKIGEK